jgi:murein DD-endopeptidase MepM/ murein hydrolase activator NlpD
MNLTRRIWVGVATTTLACALVAGSAMAERARSKRGHTAKANKARAAKAKARKQAESNTPLGERLHSGWVLYGSLAEWQLRSELDPSSYAVARRALSLAAALSWARPGAALSAALTPAPPILEQRPVAGGVSSGYGVRRDPFKRKRRKKHNGIDLRAGRGVPVLAAGPGLVAKAERMRGYGRVVYVDHGGGVQTRYAHLQKIAVQEGQFVPPGALVGKVGSSGRATGPHLHFEVRSNGKPVAPVEILGLLTAHTPLAVWLERIMDGEFEEVAADDAALAQTDEKVVKSAGKAKRKRGKAKRSKRGMRSRRPTS